MDTLYRDLLISLVPILGHFVLRVIDFLGRVDSWGEVLQQITYQEWHLVHHNVVCAISMDNYNTGGGQEH